jgi:hypothetical protein
MAVKPSTGPSSSSRECFFSAPAALAIPPLALPSWDVLLNLRRFDACCAVVLSFFEFCSLRERDPLRRLRTDGNGSTKDRNALGKAQLLQQKSARKNS